ncbi:hypothetical protein ABEX25_04255 [Paenibacillus thiaminolyticus]|uniref:hypothetical protein n=1 Tax=Paenibacillus thiaminolyticus TaxID=49283 RepID=UPI003D2C15BB
MSMPAGKVGGGTIRRTSAMRLLLFLRGRMPAKDNPSGTSGAGVVLVLPYQGMKR